MEMGSSNHDKEKSLLMYAKRIERRKRYKPLRVNSHTTIMVSYRNRTKKYARNYAMKVGIPYEPLK